MKKEWDDDNNPSRPQEVKLYLYANDVYYKTIIIKNNGWQWYERVPSVDEQGQEIVYTWKEEEISGYHNKIVTNGNKTIITNIIYREPVIPPNQPKPDRPTNSTKIIEFDEYNTALGLPILLNHVGDCFD